MNIPKMRICGNERMEGMLEFLPAGIVMVEVGVFTGESTERFAETGKVRCLYAVDRWKPWNDRHTRAIIMSDFGMDEVEREFDARMAKFDFVVKVKMASLDAAAKFEPESLDFVYIDADHSYDAVRADILAWKLKVKAGGLLGGHDYGKNEHAGVKKAVDEVFGRPTWKFLDSSWMVRL